MLCSKRKQSQTSNSSIMAETNGSLPQTHHQDPMLQSLFHAFGPISLIRSQNSSSNQPVPLRLLITEGFIMERGPRYRAYAELREAKLRMNQRKQQEPELYEPKLTPPKKQVKFQANLVSRTKGSSILAQSVPDFSATLRKENRKPVTTLTAVLEMTPPSKNVSKVNGVSSNSRGSKSASAGEKRSGGAGGFMTRKSYASVEELKGLSSTAANAINGENRRGRSSRGVVKTVLGYRQF